LDKWVLKNNQETSTEIWRKMTTENLKDYWTKTIGPAAAIFSFP